MATYAPIYEARVFATNGLARNADGSINMAGSTLLTPIAGADHSDAFHVASATGVTGAKPYMDLPRGRRGRIDFLSKRTDIGSLALRVLDKKLTQDNFQRWATAFVGDEQGRRQLMGKEVFVRESVDGGANWEPFYFGRVQRVAVAEDRTWLNLDLYDLASELEVQTFRGIPQPAYAHAASYLPLGLPFEYGPHEQTSYIPANLGPGNPHLVVDSSLRQLNSPDRDATTVVRALRRISSISRPYFGTDLDEPDEAVDGAVVNVRLVGGTRAGEEGLMWIVPFTTIGGPVDQQLTGHMVVDQQRYLHQIGVEAVNVAFDPSTWDTTTVEFAILSDGDASEDTPVFVHDVHPVQLWADILDGKFGPFASDGSVRFSTPRDVTAFDALIADTTFPTWRGFVEETPYASEFVEDRILAFANLSYYRDGEGRVVPVDLRSRSGAGVPTITNADLIAVAAPRTQTDLSSAVTDVAVKHYIEATIPRENVSGTEPFPDIKPYLLETQEAIYRVIDIGSPDVPPQKSHNVDAFGARFAPGEEAEQGLTKRKYLHGKFDELVSQLRTPYGAGAEIISLTCRRTANVTGVVQGSVALVDVDEVADPSTNRRGGPRLARCLERIEDGPAIGLTLLDLGVNVTAGVPTLGAAYQVVGAEKQAIGVPVTALNADSDPVVLHIAVTDTATVTRPVEGSGLWVMARHVTATGDWPITNLPAQKRIWVRGRSEPDPQSGGGAFLPSAWVFVSNDFVDLGGLTAPTGLTVTEQGGSYLKASFTAGEPDLPAEVWIDGFRRLTLAASQTVFEVRGLEANKLYNSPGLQVRHVNLVTNGKSAFVTVTFTTLATATVSPTYTAAVLLVGESG